MNEEKDIIEIKIICPKTKVTNHYNGSCKNCPQKNYANCIKFFGKKDKTIIRKV